MPYNLAQAGNAAGKSKSTILQAIRRGALSADRDPATGGWSIEPAELHRVYPAVSTEHGETATKTDETAELRAVIAGNEQIIAAHERTIDDLRKRLDTEAEERRRLTAILTDQRTAPRRSWWPWRWG